MIYGLFMDPRSWDIDFKSSKFWAPEKYGVKIDVCPDAFNIPKKGIDPKYKFVITSEVWEIPMRKALDYARAKGVKVFLAPREPFKTDVLRDAMFSHSKFLYNNEYYFSPDLILAAGKGYADLWQGKADTIVTGYPRFDYYVDQEDWPTKAKIAKEYGLDINKKWVFFPSYPPYHYQKVNGKDVLTDLAAAREETLFALLEFAKKHEEYQIVAKIHPSSMKPYLKGTGRGDEVSGLLKLYYKKPSKHMVVIGDIRSTGIIAKGILVNSDAVCGFTSTMLLEAAMINKPALHLLFGKTSCIKGVPEYAKYIPTAYNATEMADFLYNPFAVENPMIEKYFYHIDGRACKRMCEAIKRIM